MTAMKLRTVWLLTFPLLLLSETFAHTLVARTLDSEATHHRLVVHLAGYREYMPAAIAALLLLVGAILVRRAVTSFRTGCAQPLPGWNLVVLPPLVFVLQEQLERLAQGGADRLTFDEPAVLAGVLPQLVCGALVLWLVRTLFRVADELASALARRTARTVRRRPTRNLPRPAQASPIRLRVLASRHAGRAPPVLA